MFIVLKVWSQTCLVKLVSKFNWDQYKVLVGNVSVLSLQVVVDIRHRIGGIVVSME